MQQAYDFSEGGPVSGMAIVDTFTKLIFGEEDYTSRELLIIQAIRTVDANVLLETHRGMGEYLHDLGVGEMIQLVSRTKKQLLDGTETLVTKAGQALPLENPEHHVMNRRAH